MNSNYSDRLKSFKNGKIGTKRQKWNGKAPSMASMARAFFYFDPVSGNKDQVVCTQCGCKVSGWSGYRANPIRNHAEISYDCFVSTLGRQTELTQENSTVRNVAEFKKACLKSFQHSGIETDLAVSLASDGFIYMPLNDDQVNTVGCIGCICFPQKAYEKPTHSPKCTIPEFLRPSTEKEGHEASCLNPWPIAVQPSESLGGDKTQIPPSHGSNERNSTNNETEKNGIVSDQHNAYCLVNKDALYLDPEMPAPISKYSDIICHSIFALAKAEVKDEIEEYVKRLISGTITELEVLEMIEKSMINVLEKAHAKRISLINTETERIIATMIAEAP